MPSTRLDVALLACAIVLAPSVASPSSRASAPSWRSLGDPYWEGAAWTARGGALRQQGSADALPAFEEALRSWRAAGAVRETAEALATIGTLLNATGRSRDALPRFEEALSVASEAAAPELEAVALNGVGESHALLVEPQPAFDAFTRLLALQRRLGNGPGEVEALGNLGYVYLQIGDYVEAAALFERALEAARRFGLRSFEATLLNNLGQALSQAGDFEAARPRLEASLALEPEGNPRRAYAMVNLGGVYRETGDPRRSVGLFEEALVLFRAAGNRWAESLVLDNLGWAHSMLGAPDRAVELHLQAFALREALGGTVGLHPSLHLASRAELQRGRPEEARRLSERAYSLVEDGRERIPSRRLRANLLAPARVVYEGYVDALMRLHEARPKEGLDALAFEVSERARARSLLELVADARGAGEGGEAEPWARRLTFSELRGRALDGDTVVVAYLLGDDRSYVWACAAERLVARALPPRAEIESLARKAHDLLAARPGRRARATARAADLRRVLGELSRMLIAPIADELRSKRIAFVADGPLHYLPFAALPAPDDPSVPLLVKHEVVTLPSVTTLALLREAAAAKAPPTKGVAVFADPVYDARDERVRSAPRVRRGDAPPPRRPSKLTSSVRDVSGGLDSLGRLPFTRREALDILALAGSRGSRAALDFDASLSSVRAPDLADFRFVHFATHGLLNNARPELSGLVLSLTGPDGRPREGFLSVDQILDLRWRADLVTLSGCRTGLGRSVNGEGLVGVTRAFMVAGAPRVVASLWSVDDSATAELMRRFYAAMLGPAKQAPAAALRRAQLELRSRRARSSPYYWAAFQLHGDWR